MNTLQKYMDLVRIGGEEDRLSVCEVEGGWNLCRPYTPTRYYDDEGNEVPTRYFFAASVKEAVEITHRWYRCDQSQRPQMTPSVLACIQRRLFGRRVV